MEVSASANVDAATAANEMGYLFTDGSESALLSATSALGMSYIWFENQPRVRDKIFPIHTFVGVAGDLGCSGVIRRALLDSL